MKRNELTGFLDRLLKIDEFTDLGPNGLQVEGREDVNKIVTGVSASVELFEKAIEKKADAVIVHHGLIWNFERPLYRGGYKKRVKLLLENEINLYGYHLPLDAHESIGNNIGIARLLELQDIEPFGEYKGQFVGFKGRLDGIDEKEMFTIIQQRINKKALFFPYGPSKINHVGVISGGAQKEVQQAVLQDLDMFITGEVSEHTLHLVKEEGLHFVAAGHHATERFGIKALGNLLKEKFNIDVEYVEIPNPV